MLTMAQRTATENLNQWYQSGDQAFIIVAACMVLIMVPGIAFLYSGLSRRKSALSLIWVVMMSFSVIIVSIGTSNSASTSTSCPTTV